MNTSITTANKGEIAIYQPDNSVQLEVIMENETVWLTQAQMAELFQTTPQNITIHVGNVYKEAELEANSTCKNFLQVRQEGKRTVQRVSSFYNLDVIISVGYRVKSQRGTQFRIWASKILKDYLLKGYVINQRFERIEERVANTERQIDFFVKTALPPIEGILFDGQIFAAYAFVSDLIKSAKNSVVLIDNYVDESILLLLSKRGRGVSTTIYTQNISPQLKLDLKKHNAQYPPITIKFFNRSHDRFLFIDSDTYHIGASLKDLGKKWFAFSKMNVCPVVLGLP